MTRLRLSLAVQAAAAGAAIVCCLVALVALALPVDKVKKR